MLGCSNICIRYYQCSLIGFKVGTLSVVFGSDPHSIAATWYGLWRTQVSENDVSIELGVLVDELGGCVEAGSTITVSLPLVTRSLYPIVYTILEDFAVKGNDCE